MRWHFLLILVVGCAVGCSHANPEASAKARAKSIEVTFSAPDGVKVYADLYPGSKGADRVILMFHQANANSLEYAPIAPLVAAWGYDCLAVDQRAGGSMFDGVNRTAAGISGKADFESAYQDMEAALGWAKSKPYRHILVWGSSYSASFVLRMAAEHPEIERVLAFSPGEYFSDKGLVASWCRKIKVPTLLAFTPDELSGGGTLIQAFPKPPTVLSFPNGVHGSATLRGPDPATQYWDGVRRFLEP